MLRRLPGMLPSCLARPQSLCRSDMSVNGPTEKAEEGKFCCLSSSGCRLSILAVQRLA